MSDLTTKLERHYEEITETVSQTKVIDLGGFSWRILVAPEGNPTAIQRNF